jgi:hypothetical protein
MHRLIAFTAVLCFAPVSAALAQSSPGLQNGQVPTMQQWNEFFQQKQDFTGSPPIPAGGGTFTGKVNFLPSTTGTAGINCGVGATPSAPVNGDIWCTSVGMFVEINGGTVALGGGAATLAVPGGGTGHVSFTANLPIIGNGASALAQGTVTSSTGSTLFATATGTPANGCATWNNGDLTSSGAACNAVSAGAVNAGLANQIGWYSGAGSTISGLATIANATLVTSGAGVPSISATLPSAVQGNVTQVGTIAMGVWQGTLIGSAYGGTGVNNNPYSISLGGNLATISGGGGPFSISLSAIGNTNVTLPTSGNIPNSTGTSGGVPYYNTASTITSSAALTVNLPLFGGGAGSAPFSGTRSGNTTEVVTANTGTPFVSGNCLQTDSNHNAVDSGVVCGGATGGSVLLVTLNCAGTSCTDVGSSCGASGCFTNVYPTYTLKLNNLVATTPANNVACQIQVYTGTYQGTGYLTGVTIAGGFAVGNTSYISCMQSGSGTAAGAAPGVNGSITVTNPSANAKAAWLGMFGTQAAGGIVIPMPVYGYWNTAAVVTGFRVFFGITPGTPTSSGIASGTIEVYGNP